MERTPHEISYPSYGINIPIKDEAAVWQCGFRVHQCYELPLYYTVAMTGCSFSILIGSFLKTGGEINERYMKFIGRNFFGAIKAICLFIYLD